MQTFQVTAETLSLHGFLEMVLQSTQPEFHVWRRVQEVTGLEEKIRTEDLTL